MKSIITPLLAVIVLASCGGSHELQGKWGGRDPDGGYMELWFGDSLALSYFQSYNEFVLYNYKRNGSEVNFRVVDSRLEGQDSFSNIIVGLDQDTLILQYDFANGAIQRFNYHRISSSTPKIYPRGLNGHQEEYLQEILK